MARPISWLSRVRELHRSVTNSVRTHYQRKDLQLLFKLQPRAAQKLIELLPREQVGAALIVDKNELAAFLEKVRDADDPSKLLDELRKAPPAVTRRKLRMTLHAAADDPSLLPNSVYLKRGKLEVSFRTVQELAEALLAISKIIETPEFEKSYAREEGIPTLGTDLPRDEVRAMFRELEKMEAARWGGSQVAQGGHHLDTMQ